jgi:hypothetical protein
MASSGLSADKVATQIVAPDISGESQRVMGRELAYYETRVGEDWQPEIVHTLVQWIQISAVYLEIMTTATDHYRRVLRKNTIINLVFSTVASTASLSTFNINDANYPTTGLILKGLFSLFTVILTFSTGYIKVFQVQEKLETAIRLKQEWAVFGSKISSEMQLPPALRKNAIWLIVKMKDNYLDLIKSDMGVSKEIIRNTALDAGLKERDLRLSQLFTRIMNTEMVRLNGDIFDFDDDCDGPDCKEGDSGFFSAFRFGAKKLGKAIKPANDTRDLHLGVLESRLDMLGRQLEDVLMLQKQGNGIETSGPSQGPLLRSSPIAAPRRSSFDGDTVSARSSSAVAAADEPDVQRRRRPTTKLSSYIMKPVSPSVAPASRSSSSSTPMPPPPLPPSKTSQEVTNEYTIVPVASEEETHHQKEFLEPFKRANAQNQEVVMYQTTQEQLEVRLKAQLDDMKRYKMAGAVATIAHSSKVNCEMCNAQEIEYDGQHCPNCGYVQGENDDVRSTSSVLSRIPENESVSSGKTVTSYKG